MERPGAKEVVLKAAQNWAARGEGGRTPAATLKYLTGSLDRSKRVEPMKREYHVGPSTRMTVVRNPKGKVTLAFPKGLRAVGSGGIAGGDRQVAQGPGVKLMFRDETTISN